MKKTMFIIVVILLLVAFGVSAFMVGNYLLESKRQEELRNELANMVGTTEPSQDVPATTEPEETETTTEATEATEVPEPTMIPQYEEVYNQNNDTVGWLKIEGTKLNNPVMQTPDDPNYYLKRDFNRNASDWGTVYAWGSADVNRPSDNVTLFGHTMKDGSMFAVLHNYTEKKYWEENQLIFFDTLTEQHMYKIYAVFKISANVGSYPYHQFVDAATPEDFNDFVETVKGMSFYDTGITPQYGDKLIALSTCEYTLDNGRLVVCAVRIT